MSFSQWCVELSPAILADRILLLLVQDSYSGDQLVGVSQAFISSFTFLL